MEIQRRTLSRSKGFIQGLKKKGYRVSLWQLPYVAENAEQIDEARKNDYIAPLTKKQDSEGSNFSALDYAGTIDFTYPKATEWYKGLLKNLLDMGVTCIKTDFGENIHMDALYKGMKPELLNNLYALLYQKAAYEITKDVTGDGSYGHARHGRDANAIPCIGEVTHAVHGMGWQAR